MLLLKPLSIVSMRVCLPRVCCFRSGGNISKTEAEGDRERPSNIVLFVRLLSFFISCSQDRLQLVIHTAQVKRNNLLLTERQYLVVLHQKQVNFELIT